MTKIQLKQTQKSKAKKTKLLPSKKKFWPCDRDVKVKKQAQANLPTVFGDFEIVVYTDNKSNTETVALVKGIVKNKSNVLLRMHSKCLTGDTFFSLKCDCGSQLVAALKRIQKENCGVVIYLDQEGRGIGLANKIKAYALQEKGYDTVQANQQLGLGVDLREYHIPAKIIRDLGIKSIHLMTNNPDKIKSLEHCGIKVTKRVPTLITSNPHNKDYLNVKKKKMGHLLNKQWGHYENNYKW